MKVKKAEITAFLSLIVVLLISFIFGIIEITVIQTEKNLSRICADGAIFSVFGEYESQLMEAYHIFGLDGSYGTGEFNEDKIIGRMHYYSNKNIDYKINGIQYLTDNKGQAFREQVLTYMEQKYGIGLIEDLAGRTSVWEEESIQGEEIRQVEETILDEFEEIKSSGQSENEGADEEETESEEAEEEIPVDVNAVPKSPSVQELLAKAQAAGETPEVKTDEENKVTLLDYSDIV